MAYTEAQLAALEELIATGAQSVSYSSGGSTRTMQARSLDEMRSLRDEMKRELGLATVKPRVRLTAFSRGD